MMTNDIWEPIRLGQVYVGLRHMRAGKLRPASRSAGATLSVSLLIVRTVHSNDATSSHTLDESISALQRYSISTNYILNTLFFPHSFNSFGASSIPPNASSTIHSSMSTASTSCMGRQKHSRTHHAEDGQAAVLAANQDCSCFEGREGCGWCCGNWCWQDPVVLDCAVDGAGGGLG